MNTNLVKLPNLYVSIHIMKFNAGLYFKKCGKNKTESTRKREYYSDLHLLGSY